MTGTAPRVLVHPSAGSAHLSQIYCGLALESQRGAIRLRHARGELRRPRTGSVLRVEVDGHRVVFDVRDHPTFPASDLEWADTYAKRSFDPTSVAASARPDIVVPLGLNFVVDCPRDGFLRNALGQLAAIDQVGTRTAMTELLAASTVGSRFRGGNGRYHCSLDNYERGPSQDGSHVLLLTRTWDPSTASGERAEMRAETNRVRCDSIRALRAELGPRFVGGLAATPSALRDHPDLVVDDSLTAKPAFLRAVAHARVAVTSRGLLATNGWRLAEYLAASRPVVNEPLVHRVPGPFSAPGNQLEYTDVDQLVEAVTTLLDDDERRAAMRQANHDYYRAWVRPDALVANALAAARAGGTG